MTAFIAIWPDSSISLLSYPSGCDQSTYEDWLYDDLDAEDDPLCAKVFRLPPGYHVSTSLSSAKNESNCEQQILTVTQFHQDGKRPKRISWSPDVAFRRIMRWRMKARDRQRDADSEKFVSEMSVPGGRYPEVPPAVYAVEEIRRMESFSGIYVAVNEDTGHVEYVGKSTDVTKRVSRTRPELDGCKLAVIKIPASEIHFAELFYIAQLRPRRNSEGRKAGIANQAKECRDGR